MAKTSKIIEKIEIFAPPELAEEWDNVGWQVYLGNNNTTKILLALTITIDVVEQAIANKCDLIISHHPLIFSKINKLSSLNLSNLPVIRAIQNNIQVYSAHTNLDSSQNGIAKVLADLIGLKNTSPIQKTSEDTGLGRIGTLEEVTDLNIFLEKLKNILEIDKFNLVNPVNKTKIKKIAVCPGSGGDFIRKLKGVDLYITGDIKYHNAIEVYNMAVVDVGHLESERIILPVLKDLLNEFAVEIIIAKEKSPWIQV